MACLDEDGLLALLGGTLSAEEERAVDEHVAGCVACQKLIASCSGDFPAPIAAAEEPLVDEAARIGRYQVIGPLAAGGMGIVYAARDPDLGRRVALKFLRSEGDASEKRARVLREAQAMARLSHPNVVAVYEVGTYRDQVFIAMELVEGSTLGEWLRARPRSWREVASVFLLAGRGLAAAHEKGLVHRDFKPDNVLIGADGSVRVSDFGLVRLQAGESEPPAPTAEVEPHAPTAEVEPPAPAVAVEPPAPALSSLARSRELVGSPAYMAPEQLRGEPADARSDQFSFCVALYESVCGRRPFTGSTIAELREEAGRGQVPALPGEARAPAFLSRILARGLSPNPEQRYPSMTALLEDLDLAPARRARWRRAAAAAALLAVLLALGAAGWVRARAGLCKGAADELAKVWSHERRDRLAKALGGAAAGGALDSLSSALDAYGAAWAQMRTQACEATRLRGEQSEALLDLRMSCLARRLVDVESLLGAVEAGRKLDAAAGQAVAQLAPLSLCANAQALQAVGPLPADRAAQKSAAALGERVSRLEAARLLGATKGGVAEGRALVGAARALGYKPLVAEALLALGGAQDLAGEANVARSTVIEAAAAATAARDDALAARAFTRLVRFDNVSRQFAQARAWAALAAGALERMGGDEALELTRFVELARVVRNEGNFEESIELGQAILARARHLGGDESVQVAGARYDLATALRNVGRLEEAEQEMRAALALVLKLHGERHRRTLTVRSGLGIIEMKRGELPEAEKDLRLALAGTELLTGADNPAFATDLINLSEVASQQGRAAEALSLARRALGIFQQKLGDEAPQTMVAQQLVGEMLLGAGEPRAAATALERVLARGGAASDALGLADLKASLAHALFASGGDRARARALGAEARATWAAFAERFPFEANRRRLASLDERLAQLR